MKVPKLGQKLPIGGPHEARTAHGVKSDVPVQETVPVSNPPTTEGKDRVGVQNKTGAQGSNEATSRLHRDPELDVEALRRTLPSAIAELVIKAIRSVGGPVRREALLGLDLILAREGPEKSLVSIFMTRPRRSVTEAEVSGFRATSTRPEVIAEGLARAQRSHLSLSAGAYLPLSVRTQVQDALLAHPNADEVKHATEWIMHMTPRKNRGSYLVERLREKGVVADGPEGLQLVRPQDVVSAFASAHREGLRPTTGYVATPAMRATASRLADEIRKSGLTEDPHWTRSDPSGRRGLLAEHLRKLQLDLEVSGSTAQVVQGILLLRVPAGLRDVQSLAEAYAYCDQHNIDHDKLFHARTSTGGLYGLTYTEMDLAVVKPDPDGRLRFLSFENVKAGSGNAGHAREQNAKAVEGLSNPEVVFLFPDPTDGYRDRSAELVRDNGPSINCETVGPLDNPGYSKSYGLGSEMLDLVRDALSA